MGACSSSKPITKQSNQASNRQMQEDPSVVNNNVDEPIQVVIQNSKQEDLNQENQDQDNLYQDNPQSDIDHLEINEEDNHKFVDEELLLDNTDDTIQKPADTVNFINTGQTLMQHRNQSDVKVLQKLTKKTCYCLDIPNFFTLIYGQFNYLCNNKQSKILKHKPNQLLESVYQRKSESITSYSKTEKTRRSNNKQSLIQIRHQIQDLHLQGFQMKAWIVKLSMKQEILLTQILQPGFIFEVIVSKKNTVKGKLDVILQKFLAFSDKCLTSQHQVRQADFQQFKKQKHLLSQLSQINVMRMKGVIYEQDVIEDFSIFTYYINFEKIQVGDHLNAVLIDKTKMIMSLKNKSIMGGKQWSLKSLQNPSHFDNWLYFRLGYAKQIGVNFQYQIMNEEERQKTQESIYGNLKFKQETGILKMDYQIEQDGFFPNKQNYPFMMQSLGLSQNTSFTSRNNLKTFMKINLDHRRHFQVCLSSQISNRSMYANRRVKAIIEKQQNKKHIINIHNFLVYSFYSIVFKLNIYLINLLCFLSFKTHLLQTRIYKPSLNHSINLKKTQEQFPEIEYKVIIPTFLVVLDLQPDLRYQEKVQFTLQSNPAVNTIFLNDQQDILLKFQLGIRILQILTLDKPVRDQKDEEQNVNHFLPSTYPYQQQSKLKIEIKLEDTDEIEVNGNDNIVTILTRAQIKQTKNDQIKKQIQCLHQDIASKNEAQIVQIQMKFQREWYLKSGNSFLAAKKVLQDYFKSLSIPKTKFTAFDIQAPPPEQQVQPEIAKKQPIKPDVSKEPEKEQEEEEVPPDVSGKDLQNLFPLVSEDFVQRQREAIDKSNKFDLNLENSTPEEKIKRLFEEVRIKQFKSQPYSADKNFFKCPYHRCQKGYKRPNQLKNHMKQNHQKLSEIGFTIDDNGEFKYNDRILDYCLLLWKVYPNFVKSVINEMRQRKEQPSA
ncbi:unnamed protein product (macronuclear) [Paramecium tetraurelia]|uniref:C2H2-type domain-containing protein n=1 Tax=Paramecium tetraurelia TaxID=5888 RepID=A0DD21_PARTE|nr:uncharacterized protein GSPATT00015797001 [Paramecium tetraurelia]CAK80938.1 unnamed protein product [Paramecium tetraurelia]|eukprot:XP_001448335.1 hypothetical protein (macronuclear) [Paramecium tetraurelia strain d4-2]